MEKQTPLIDLLENVPRDAVLVVEHDQFSSSFHPVGRLCHEAAAALRVHVAALEEVAEVCRGTTCQMIEAAQQPAAVDGAIDRARFERAPCYLCGYNGPGYYKPDTHPCAAKYHAALEELHLAEVRVQELARKTLGAQQARR